jgi:hypothetical protein
MRRGRRLRSCVDRFHATADRFKATADRLKVTADRLKVTADRLKATAGHLKTIPGHFFSIRDSIHATPHGMNPTARRLRTPVSRVNPSVCRILVVSPMRKIVLAAFLIVPLVHCSSVVAFDFQNPGCKAQVVAPAANEVDVRYLGSGGVYIGWGGDKILLGPFFSKHSLVTAGPRYNQPDRERIRTHLPPETRDVAAILAGHSHYDHIGDVPVIAQEYATGAQIYVNTAGVHMLHGYADLRPRTHELLPDQEYPIAPSIRLRTTKSDHAPQLCRWRHWPCTFAFCDGNEVWDTPFEQHKLNEFCVGVPLAFTIELLDGARNVKYRIYYNDTSPDAPLGVPPAGDYDLAILAIPQYNHVAGYPEQVVAATHPKHVVISHFENFFEKSDGSWKFVANLSTKEVGRFIERFRHEAPFSPPVNDVCGAKGQGWTMPIPGEQMRFRVTR